MISHTTFSAKSSVTLAMILSSRTRMARTRSVSSLHLFPRTRMVLSRVWMRLVMDLKTAITSCSVFANSCISRRLLTKFVRCQEVQGMTELNTMGPFTVKFLGALLSSLSSSPCPISPCRTVHLQHWRHIAFLRLCPRRNRNANQSAQALCFRLMSLLVIKAEGFISHSCRNRTEKPCRPRNLL